MTTKEIVQLVLGVSLGINGWLIQMQVANMSESMDKMSESLSQVKIDHARMSKEVDLQHNWINSHHDRLQYVEAAVNKFQGYFERRN